MARLGSWDVGGVDLGWFDVGALASGWIDKDLIPFPATVGGWFTAGQGGRWWEIPLPLSKKKRRRWPTALDLERFREEQARALAAGPVEAPEPEPAEPVQDAAALARLTERSRPARLVAAGRSVARADAVIPETRPGAIRAAKSDHVRLDAVSAAAAPEVMEASWVRSDSRALPALGARVRSPSEHLGLAFVLDASGALARLGGTTVNVTGATLRVLAAEPGVLGAPKSLSRQDALIGPATPGIDRSAKERERADAREAELRGHAEALAAQRREDDARLAIAQANAFGNAQARLRAEAQTEEARADAEAGRKREVALALARRQSDAALALEAREREASLLRERQESEATLAAALAERNRADAEAEAEFETERAGRLAAERELEQAVLERDAYAKTLRAVQDSKARPRPAPVVRLVERVVQAPPIESFVGIPPEPPPELRVDRAEQAKANGKAWRENKARLGRLPVQWSLDGGYKLGPWGPFERRVDAEQARGRLQLLAKAPKSRAARIRLQRELAAPKTAEAQFVRDLVALFKPVHAEVTRIVMGHLRRDEPVDRTDAPPKAQGGAGTKPKPVSPSARIAAVGGLMGAKLLRGIDHHVKTGGGVAFERMATAVHAKTHAQILSLIPITPSNAGIQDLVDDAREASLDYMVKAGRAYVDQVRDVLEDEANFEKPVGALAQLIEDRADVSSSRAMTIARTTTTQLHSSVMAERHRSAGIDRFVWSCSLDERVRGNPDGLYPKADPSHWDLEGQTFSYDDPPEADVDGEPALPGQPINCRCVALPVLEQSEEETPEAQEEEEATEEEDDEGETAAE